MYLWGCWKEANNSWSAAPTSKRNLYPQDVYVYSYSIDVFEFDKVTGRGDIVPVLQLLWCNEMLMYNWYDTNLLFVYCFTIIFKYL
jgi:hypothetical protein